MQRFLNTLIAGGGHGVPETPTGSPPRLAYKPCLVEAADVSLLKMSEGKDANYGGDRWKPLLVL